MPISSRKIITTNHILLQSSGGAGHPVEISNNSADPVHLNMDLSIVDKHFKIKGPIDEHGTQITHLHWDADNHELILKAADVKIIGNLTVESFDESVVQRTIIEDSIVTIGTSTNNPESSDKTTESSGFDFPYLDHNHISKKAGLWFNPTKYEFEFSDSITSSSGIVTNVQQASVRAKLSSDSSAVLQAASTNNSTVASTQYTDSAVLIETNRSTSAMSEEVNVRSQADTANATAITANATAITAEASLARAAEAVNSTAIVNEATARLQADTILTSGNNLLASSINELDGSLTEGGYTPRSNTGNQIYHMEDDKTAADQNDNIVGGNFIKYTDSQSQNQLGSYLNKKGGVSSRFIAIGVGHTARGNLNLRRYIRDNTTHKYGIYGISNHSFNIGSQARKAGAIYCSQLHCDDIQADTGTIPILVTNAATTYIIKDNQVLGKEDFDTDGTRNWYKAEGFISTKMLTYGNEAFWVSFCQSTDTETGAVYQTGVTSQDHIHYQTFLKWLDINGKTANLDEVFPIANEATDFDRVNRVGSLNNKGTTVLQGATEIWNNLNIEGTITSSRINDNTFYRTQNTAAITANNTTFNNSVTSLTGRIDSTELNVNSILQGSNISLNSLVELVTNYNSLNTSQITTTNALDGRLDVLEALPSITDGTTQSLLTTEANTRAGVDAAIRVEISNTITYLKSYSDSNDVAQNLIIALNTAKTGITSSESVNIAASKVKTDLMTISNPANIDDFQNDLDNLNDKNLADHLTPLTGAVNINTMDGSISTNAARLANLTNVENSALSTFAGTSNILTLGTIGTGTWQGTAIADSYISSASTWDAKQNAIGSGNRIDASFIGSSGNVSNIEYGHLSNVTSDIQTQITNVVSSASTNASNISTNASNITTANNNINLLAPIDEPVFTGFINTSKIKVTGLDFKIHLNNMESLQIDRTQDVIPNLRITVFGGNAQSAVQFNNKLILKNVPTSSSGLVSGSIWSDSGTLKIV